MPFVRLRRSLSTGSPRRYRTTRDVPRAVTANEYYPSVQLLRRQPSHQRVGERLCNTLESGRPWREALLVRAKVISVEFPRRSDHLVHGRDLIDQTDRFGLVAGPDLATTVVNISL